jgi:hypothetical protein
LVVGSGLRVDQDGVAYNHHFLPPKDGTVFQFLAGEYLIEVYAMLANGRRPVLMSSLKLDLSQDHVHRLQEKTNAVLYNWGPDSQTYHPHTDRAPTRGRERSVSGSGYETLSRFR